MPTKLTELQVRNAKPREKKYTMAAGGGLTLLVMPDGSRYWRLRYRFGGKSRMLAVGRPYPETSLKQALATAATLRAKIAGGEDPAEARRTEKLQRNEMVANSFGDAAEAWFAFRSGAWSPKTSGQARSYLEKDLLPALRGRPLDKITPSELGVVLAKIEGRGAFDVAKKVRQWLNGIYSFARAKGWTAADPARDLAAVALPAPASSNYAHLQLDDVPEFLHALNQYQGSSLVKQCAWLALWTANRPGVTRSIKWSELDLDAGIWTIDRNREGMKRGYYHLTPLPRQAIAMLRSVQPVSGGYEHVFIGRNDPGKPISDGAIAGMIKRIGYRNKQTMHGFRHLISTALNDQGYEVDWIERQLAHGDPDKIRGTYNKAAYLKPRSEMMQDWADYLDMLMTPASVIPIGRAAG